MPAIVLALLPLFLIFLLKQQMLLSSSASAAFVPAAETASTMLLLRRRAATSGAGCAPILARRRQSSSRTPTFASPANAASAAAAAARTLSRRAFASSVPGIGTGGFGSDGVWPLRVAAPLDDRDDVDSPSEDGPPVASADSSIDLQLVQVEDRIASLNGGTRINPNSPAQVSSVVFGDRTHSTSREALLDFVGNSDDAENGGESAAATTERDNKRKIAMLVLRHRELRSEQRKRQLSGRDAGVVDGDGAKSSFSTSFKSRAPTGGGEKQRQRTAQAAQLPPPSEEQRAVVDAVLSGHCVVLPSVAGSGKTTCMLQVAAALPPGRTVAVITYNRALCDECKAKVAEYGLRGRVKPFTIHGIVSKAAGRTVNDDAKLRRVLAEWDEGGMDAEAVRRAFGAVDLVLLDEAQDLRPTFYGALRHILRVFAASSPRTADADDEPSSPSIQMCLVGDPKQMLYDFPTFGSDRASTRFMDRPEEHWGDFTGSRLWVRRRLTTSFRLTPNVASFVNAIWGTDIVGGNDRAPNRPVEYYVKYPFPDKSGNDDPTKLSTKFLDGLITSYGPENVLLLAQSVKNENCPIRVHVNELSKLRGASGQRVHNFHIKESARGYEGNTDVMNKVRCWTFCASKGCEADVVVIFGLDMPHLGRVHALNQIGVALSRARKRLIVIHGMSYVQGKGMIANPYYPLLGDSTDGMTSHEVSHSGCQVIRMSVPPYMEGNRESLARRSDLTQTVLEQLADAGVVNVAGNNSLPETTSQKAEVSKNVVYVASEFAYFAASEEDRFLSYADWTKLSGVTDRIDYTVAVQFQQTTEDISALYGEALTYMLQWERDGFCPSIESVVNDGILVINPSFYYDENMVRNQLNSMQCEKLSAKEERLFQGEFSDANGKAKGKDLILFFNTRINLKKKRKVEGETRYFRVMAFASANNEDDIMKTFLAQIRTVYESPDKTPSQWVYLANAVMAFSNYHEKWNQIGTDPNSYEWVESDALRAGFSRLMELMTEVDSSQKNSTFERYLLFDFPKEHYIGSPTRSESVVGVQGICDWVGHGLQSSQGMSVDLLEIKFVSELSNMHRLQVLTYCALLAIEKDAACAGMIFNARTSEMEVCRVEASVAEDFLFDIAQFKFNGERRQPITA